MATRVLLFNNVTGEVLNCDFLVIPGLYSNVVSVTTTYAIGSKDEVVVCSNTTPFTVTLPAATGTGHRLDVKNINTGSITLEGNLSETIDGELNQTVDQWENITVVDYATGTWGIL